MKTKAEIRKYAEEVIADIQRTRKSNWDQFTDYMKKDSDDALDMWKSIKELAKG